MRAGWRQRHSEGAQGARRCLIVRRASLLLCSNDVPRKQRYDVLRCQTPRCLPVVRPKTPIRAWGTAKKVLAMAHRDARKAHVLDLAAAEHGVARHV